jgi:hypothetical protein
MSEEIPKLLSYKEFCNIAWISQLGFTEVRGWSDVLGTNWTSESEKQNYETYKKYYLARFTKLGKYLAGGENV